MARSWNSLGKQLTAIAKRQGPDIVRRQAPRLIEALLTRRTSRHTADRPRSTPDRSAIPVRPVASAPMPTAERARRVVYAPQLDGRADPGEVVWTWVPFEEDPGNGKDRPVLVVGRDNRTLLGLMLSSNPARADHSDWVGIGAGTWDHQGRESWVRLDRVLEVPEDGIRREGAILPRRLFDRVAHRLVREYRWR